MNQATGNIKWHHCLNFVYILPKTVVPSIFSQISAEHSEYFHHRCFRHENQYSQIRRTIPKKIVSPAIKVLFNRFTFKTKYLINCSPWPLVLSQARHVLCN